MTTTSTVLVDDMTAPVGVGLMSPVAVGLGCFVLCPLCEGECLGWGCLDL